MHHCPFNVIEQTGLVAANQKSFGRAACPHVGVAVGESRFLESVPSSVAGNLILLKSPFGSHLHVGS